MIVGAIAAAHGNRLPGAFVFDDFSSVVENASIRTLRDWRAVLSPPIEAGVGGRPFANLTFALNYALHGLNPAGYHATNLALHALSALTLFGLMRRTLWLAPARNGIRRAATPLAAASAALWATHPLTTAAVNYVAQRTELLMALFYLLTLYALVRSAEVNSRRWAALSVAACALGMASKEAMITAPLMVLLYDRTFLSKTWANAWRERPGLYLGLAGTWLLLGGLIAVSQIGERGVGFAQGITAWRYGLTQSHAVLLYLQRALWPEPLVFDYGWAFASLSIKAVFRVVICVFLAAASFAAWRRHQLAGFVGVVFFVLLAPTSSFIPIIQQPIAESRMYLPIAVLVAAFVGVCASTLRARAVWPLSAVFLAFVALTMHRNAAFRSEVALWSNTVANVPGNARAHANLSAALLRANRAPEAITAAETAVRLMPGYAAAHHNLALGLLRAGRLAEAIVSHEKALSVAPGSGDTRFNFGEALVQAGRWEDAIAQFEATLRINPRHSRAHNNLSVVLLRLGRAGDAVTHAREALRLSAEFPEALYNLGNALAQLGERDAALANYEAALRLQPAFARAHNNIGVLRLQAGEVATAIVHFEAAIQADPAYEPARANLERARSGGRTP